MDFLQQIMYILTILSLLTYQGYIIEIWSEGFPKEKIPMNLETNVKPSISTTWTVTSFVPNTWNYAKILPILDDNLNPIVQSRMASNAIKFFMPNENSQVCHSVTNSRNTTVVRGNKHYSFGQFLILMFRVIQKLR